jgi:hypothetical protein
MPESSTSVSLDNLKDHIGDYAGYGDTGLRQQSDKKIRTHLIGIIRNLIEQLQQEHKVADEKEQGRLNELLSRTRRRLATISESLKSPTYVYEPFFQSAPIPVHRLSRIYDLENKMLEEMGSLNMEVSDLFINGKKRDVFEEHFLHIDTFVDNINQALFEREALILGDE